jgi:hypothetical protein
MKDAIKEIDEAMPQEKKAEDAIANKTYKIRLKPEHNADDPENAGKVLEWTMPQILEEINKERSDAWTPYDESDWQEGLTEWTWYEPAEEVTADLSTDKTVFEDTNSGEVFTKEQLDSDPNKDSRTLKTHEVSSQYINDMFKEASTIELSLAQKNLLRAAFHYCGFEKVAYLSEDSFSIKAGDAVITVDNDKATSLPFALFNDVALGEDSKEKEEAKSDLILG